MVEIIECPFGVYFDFGVTPYVIRIHKVNCGNYKQHGGPNTDGNDNCWIHEPTIDEAKQVTRILSKKSGLNIETCPDCKIDV